MKRAKRILLISTAAILAVLLLAAGAAVCPPVQTWAARKVLASLAPPGATLEGVSVGFNRTTLRGLRIEEAGFVLLVPTADAEFGVVSAALRRRYLVKNLVAKGWTLDLTQVRPDGGRPVAPAEAGAGNSWVADAVGGMLAAFNVPAGLSLEGVDLEGVVVLPDGRGHRAGAATVVVTGGGLAAGHDGNFLCTAVVTLDDGAAPVSTVAVRATLAAAMDASGTFTRADLKADATASGRQFPNGVGLSCTASAARNADRKTYSFALVRGTERVASIDADSPDNSRRMAGSWRLDLKDTDLAPFALGHVLPAFYVAGAGSYDFDIASGDLHAVGRLHASADRLGVISPRLTALGAVRMAADFDVARMGNSLRVDRLETTLAGIAPVASLRALQPFEFNAATGELKVARPAGDLVGISVEAVPLSWLRDTLGEFALAGGDAQGEFVMRAEDGRMALRTKAPLRVNGAGLSRQGRPIASGLEVSAFVLADYSPQGWQVQLAPLAIRSDGIEMISVQARLGWLAGTGQAAKAAGTWSSSIPALLAQPAAAGLPRLAGGEASGSFEASLDATRELRVKLALRDLALSTGEPVTLPAVNCDIRADFDGNGHVAFDAPLSLDYGPRTAELSLSGTLSRSGDGPRFVAVLSGGKISIDDLRAVAALASGGAAAAAPGPADAVLEPPRPRPIWPPTHGTLSVRFESIALPRFDLRDVRATVLLSPDSLRLDAASAAFGEAGGAKVNGELAFAPGAGRPYSYQANLTLENADSAPIFQAIDPGRPPAIDGRFGLVAHLSGSGAVAGDLLQGTQGDCKILSKDGKFRALRTDVMESIKQAPSKLLDALDTVTALFGKKTDKIGEALVEAANGLSEIHYDQLSLTAVRGADLDVHFTEINLIAPEERITGTGTITHVEGAPVQSQPLSVDLDMGVRGQLGKFLAIVGMLKDGHDELGYTELYQVIHLGGSLQNIDQSQWREMLVQAPLRKGGGLFDKLLGR